MKDGINPNMNCRLWSRALLTSLLIVSLLLFSLCVAFLPFIGTAPADPWWILKVMPTIYWAGIASALITFFISLKANKMLEAWLCIFLLTALIWSIPKLMFSNPIWTDTYLFVGESFHVLEYGRIGFGHSMETPNLSTLIAQLDLATGLNHELLATIIPIAFLPYLAVVMIYILATSVLNKKYALIASLVFISLNWNGLYFNRASLFYPLYILVVFLIVKYAEHRTQKMFLALLISFLALILGHPGESAAVPLGLITVLFLILSLTLLRKRQFNLSSYKLVTISILFVFMWFGWQIYTGKAFFSAILYAVNAWEELLSGVSPIEVLSVGRYTQQYMPILDLRLYWSVGTFMVGLVFFLLHIIYKSNRKHTVLGSFLLVSLAIAAYTSYTGQSVWRYRTFESSWPITAVFIASSIRHLNESSERFKGFRRTLKVFLLASISIFIVSMPLLMYSHMAFVYPTDSNLAMHDFLTKRGIGYVAVLGGHTVTDYYILKNNASLSPFPYRGDPEPGDLLTIEEKNYDIIATTFRMYTKGAFVKYQSSLAESIELLKDRIDVEPTYNKIYSADEQHEIYSKIR